MQPRVALDWSRSVERVAGDPASAATYLIDGQAPTVGTIMRHPRLAATLKRIAQDGPRGFYEGPVAEDIVARLRDLGGLHTLDDFATAAPEIVTPVTTRYRGYDVYECPPSGQGLAVLMMLNVLSHYDIAALSELDRVHLFRGSLQAGLSPPRRALRRSGPQPGAGRAPAVGAWRASAHGAIDMARARSR